MKNNEKAEVIAQYGRVLALHMEDPSLDLASHKVPCALLRVIPELKGRNNLGALLGMN